MDAHEKVRENRLRRKLDRMGYRLVKARRRDPDAIDYGKYIITDIASGVAVAGSSADGRWYELDLDDVEQWIAEEAKR